MISDGTDVRIREGDVEEAVCRSSGAKTIIVTGHLEVEELSAGWYTVAVAQGSGQYPLVTLYIGNWTEEAAPTERWAVRVGITHDGPVLQDWSEEQAQEARAVFTPLAPMQVEGSPMEPQLWTLLDRILQDDSRL